MAHYSKEKQTNSGIYYRVFGEAKKQPILLIPGFTGTHQDVAGLANILKENYYVLIPEFPGWGDAYNQHSSYTISGYADILKNLIEGLPLLRVPVVAHCMGATVALETAYKYPHIISELILISTPYQDGTITKKFFLFLAKTSKKVPNPLRPLFFFWRSRVITTPISFFVLKTKTFRKKVHIVWEVLKKQSHQNEHVLEANWDSLLTYDYKKLRNIKVPVHIVHGQEDLLISPKQAKKLAALLPHATCDFIPHAGHLPPVETPVILARLIEKYL